MPSGNFRAGGRGRGSCSRARVRWPRSRLPDLAKGDRLLVRAAVFSEEFLHPGEVFGGIDSGRVEACLRAEDADAVFECAELLEFFGAFEG